VAVCNGTGVDRNEITGSFLAQHGLGLDEVDMILHGGKQPGDDVRSDSDTVDYTELCGLYPTASAFGFHYGADFLESAGRNKKVLIVNELSPRNLGLILLKGIEA